MESKTRRTCRKCGKKRYEQYMEKKEESNWGHHWECKKCDESYYNNRQSWKSRLDNYLQV